MRVAGGTKAEPEKDPLDIKKLDPDIRLFDWKEVKDMGLYESHMAVLKYIIKKNMEGILPLRKTAEEEFQEFTGNKFKPSSVGNFIHSYKKDPISLVGSYTALKIAKVYGEQRNSTKHPFEMPLSLRHIEFYLEKYPVSGRGAGTSSWNNKNLDATRYPHVLLAKVKKYGRPVFGKMFSYTEAKDSS